MKKFYLLILISSICYLSNAQNYEINVKINGIKDTVIYLGHHFGEKKLAVDTAKIDSKGNAVFKKNKELGRGIYMIFVPTPRGMNYFELLITEKYPKFSIETDTTDYIKSMKIKNNNDNLVFNEYQKRTFEIQKQLNKLSEDYQKNIDNKEETENIQKEWSKLLEERKDYVNSLITKYPDSFFTKILKALFNEPEIPEPIKDDQELRFYYFKGHFFDNVDFSENGLLRTPIFEGKINEYLKRCVLPDVDSLIKETKYIITKAYNAGDSLVYQYTLSYLLSMYDTSKIMGYDAVLCAIAEDWYLAGKAPWADTAYLAKVRERVEDIEKILIGKVAPDLVRMQSIDDKYYTLSQMPQDYIVLAFWEPSCGHCKKEIPKLMQEYRDSLKAMNIKVLAVYTQYDKKEWEKFVEEKNLKDDGWINLWDGPYPHSNFRENYNIKSTPQIFVLDKNKTIIGKRISIEDIKGLVKFDIERKAKTNKK